MPKGDAPPSTCSLDAIKAAAAILDVAEVPERSAARMDVIAKANGFKSVGELMAAIHPPVARAHVSPIVVPIRTVPGLNAREHWRVKAKRVQKERHATAWVLRGATRPAVPCSVILTRLAPSSGVDDDNLVGALKGVRDEIAAWLGVDDRRRDQVRYRYAQARGEWGVRIEFGPPVVGAQLAFDIGDAA